MLSQILGTLLSIVIGVNGFTYTNKLNNATDYTAKENLEIAEEILTKLAEEQGIDASELHGFYRAVYKDGNIVLGAYDHKNNKIYISYGDNDISNGGEYYGILVHEQTHSNQYQTGKQYQNEEEIAEFNQWLAGYLWNDLNDFDQVSSGGQYGISVEDWRINEIDNNPEGAWLIANGTVDLFFTPKGDLEYAPYDFADVNDPQFAPYFEAQREGSKYIAALKLALQEKIADEYVASDNAVAKTALYASLVASYILVPESIDDVTLMLIGGQMALVGKGGKILAKGDDVVEAMNRADGVVLPSTKTPDLNSISSDIKDWLGENTKVVTNKSGDKVFVSADGTRRVRFDFNNPYPHNNPHMHVEEIVDGSWNKSGQIYPKDVPNN